MAKELKDKVEFERKKQTPQDKKEEKLEIPKYFSELELDDDQRKRITLEIMKEFDAIKCERDDAGLYHQTSNLIAAHPRSTDAFVVEKFQMEMLTMALRAYDSVPRAQRMTASTTLGMSKETFDLVVMKAREFRREIMEIARLDTQPDRVCQLTLNLFPLAHAAEETREDHDEH